MKEEKTEGSHYVTFKFFDEKKRRMSIFAKQTAPNKLEIFEWTCSKKDQFCKKTARDAYDFFLKFDHLLMGGFILLYGIKYHPHIYRIPIGKGNSAKYTFLHHCFSNYYKAVPISFTVNTYKLIKYSNNGRETNI